MSLLVALDLLLATTTSNRDCTSTLLSNVGIYNPTFLFTNFNKLHLTIYTIKHIERIQMKTRDFEDKVWEVEGIRIVLHAGNDVQVGDYNYKKAADESWRITEFGEKRLEKHLNGITYSTIQGDGEEPHGRVILRTVRNGYSGK